MDWFKYPIRNFQKPSKTLKNFKQKRKHKRPWKKHQKPSKKQSKPSKPSKKSNKMKQKKHQKPWKKTIKNLQKPQRPSETFRDLQKPSKKNHVITWQETEKGGGLDPAWKLHRMLILCIMWPLQISATFAVTRRLENLSLHVPLKYSIYPVLKNILSIFLCFLIFVFFNIFPDPCPKSAKNDFNREQMCKNLGFEHIPTIFIFSWKSGLKMYHILSTPWWLYI